MKQLCVQCHTSPLVERVYAEGRPRRWRTPGLGLLLIVNRMVKPDDVEWAHVRAVFRQPGPTFFGQLLTGAPPMAPLLFPNLVMLGLIGLWALADRLPSGSRGG